MQLCIKPFHEMLSHNFILHMPSSTLLSYIQVTNCQWLDFFKNYDLNNKRNGTNNFYQ